MRASNKPTIKLVITDLDNTLYDWVTWFSKVVERATTKNAVMDGAKMRELNVERRDTEYAINNYARSHDVELELYPGVPRGLETIRQKCPIVAHTGAMNQSAMLRIKRLGLDRYLSRLYSMDDKRRHERKPHVPTIRRIVREHGVGFGETLYIGDSLHHDIGPAIDAGLHTAWAKYGLGYDPKCWDIIKRISHWTEEDIECDRIAKETFGDAEPDVTLGRFDEVLSYYEFADSTRY